MKNSKEEGLSWASQEFWGQRIDGISEATPRLFSLGLFSHMNLHFPVATLLPTGEPWFSLLSLTNFPLQEPRTFS